MRRPVIATFWPHHSNGYKPHAVRYYGITFVIVAILSIQAVYNLSTTGSFSVLGYASNINVSDLLSLTNRQRTTNNLQNLSLDSKLNGAASQKASHMVTHNYWAHIAPDGTSPWHFIGEAGYSYIKAGENLAYGFSSSSGVVDGWMNSASHRANILDKQFRDVGFGIVNGAKYQGGKNTVVVAMYGQPYNPSPVVATNNDNQPASTNVAPTTTNPSTRQKQTVKRSQPTKPKAPRPPDNNSHRYLSQLNGDALYVAGAKTQITNQVKRVSNLEALLRGDATWAHYASIGLIGTLAIIYLIRHAFAIAQFALKGEHYIEGHPLLEASIIYGLLWVILASSYGVIL